MNFIAIDFETANDRRDSACAVAIAVVQNGQVAEAKTWLIRPEPLEFSAMNVSIHGITEDDVRDAPLFADVWAEILKYLDGNLIVAHNAGFDIGVLRRLLVKYQIDHPRLPYFCTRVFSRHAFPGQISYSLPVIAEHLGIDFSHHDPAQDAIACAEIALRCCLSMGFTDLEGYLEAHSIRCGEVFPGGYRSWLRPGQRPQDLTPENDDLDTSHPFFGRTIVFTGTLLSMVRADAMQSVVNAGGKCGVGVTKKTDYLVVGEQDFAKFRGGDKSSKMAKAEQLLANGVDIEILPEPEFMRLL